MPSLNPEEQPLEFSWLRRAESFIVRLLAKLVTQWILADFTQPFQVAISI